MKLGTYGKLERGAKSATEFGMNESATELSTCGMERGAESAMELGTNEWPRNRHAGEPSPARPLKIPAQKCVGEVGGEGVFGTADLVCSRIFAERAGGVGVGVGDDDCGFAQSEVRNWKLEASFHLIHYILSQGSVRYQFLLKKEICL